MTAAECFQRLARHSPILWFAAADVPAHSSGMILINEVALITWCAEVRGRA
jgi:hypothetical protein